MAEDVAPAGEPAVTAVLTVTPAARAVVLEARSQEADSDRLALWVEVTGSRDGAYTYDIYFQSAADAGPADPVAEDGGLSVVVPESSVARLVGARLDWSEDGEGGLVIVNPNTPPRPEAFAPHPEVDLTSELAQRVQGVTSPVERVPGAAGEVVEAGAPEPAEDADHHVSSRGSGRRLSPC